MSNDEVNFEDETSEDEISDDAVSDDLFDDESADEDVLLEEDDASEIDDDNNANDNDNDTAAVASDSESETASDSDSESDTEALDDLEAEELEMLTEDEASETIVVDEETQLRDIRRAQLSMEAGVAGGATEGEFVCSVCFLVKNSSQLSSRRKKVCLDCAV